MSFTANIQDQSVEKNFLVVLRPRCAVTAWASVSGVVYSTPFAFGRATKTWTANLAGSYFTKVSSLAAVVNGTFFHDVPNGILYAGKSAPPTTLYVEYELNISNQAFTGLADPLDATSEIVNWIPALQKEPIPQNGDRTTLFGFLPLQPSNIEIINADGWLNVALYSHSFNFAYCKAWVMTNASLENGIAGGDVKAIFTGFTWNSFSQTPQGGLSIPVTDFSTLLDAPIIPPQKYTTANYPSADPAISRGGAEWYIRYIRGYVSAHLPVNVVYNGTASTSNNRHWMTHADEGTAQGSLAYTIDATATNADAPSTKTYLTVAHQLNIGDSVWLVDSGVNKYVTVLTMSRAGKWFTHASLTRTVIGGDTAARSYIGNVAVTDAAGIIYPLLYGRDYIESTPDGIARGFVLQNNFEANVSFADTTFDPSKHKIRCNVYGPKQLQTYADGITGVGFDVNDGGIDATAVGILYWLLTLAGIPKSTIDQTSFAAVGADSMALSLVVPASASSQTLPTFKDAISSVITSMLWKMGYSTVGNDVLIGLVEIKPLPGSPDQSAVEIDHSIQALDADFADIYNLVYVQPFPQEVLFTRESQLIPYSSVNNVARDLHFNTKSATYNVLQYVGTDAQKIASRLSFILGDRRLFYTLLMDQKFIDKVAVGSAVNLSRQSMPGFPFVQNTLNTRMLSGIEVQKSTSGVTIVLEDQKGVQDNAGSW